MSFIDLQRAVLSPGFGLFLVHWSLWHFRPYQLARDLGLAKPSMLGTPPPIRTPRGGGRDLSSRQQSPVYLDETPDDYDDVCGEFDYWSEKYDEALELFVGPIFDETFALMRPYLAPSARVLDPSCGPGRNAIGLARALPHGEVVAADLSHGMVATAHKRALAAGLDNMAFFQADVVNPPLEFEGYFDAIFSCLSFHHYTDAQGAVRALRRVLAPGGTVFIADCGPDWSVALMRPVAKIADPGFVRHRTGQEFRTLLQDAGFSSVYWVHALPGIGVTIATI